jgi:N-methylhydantoinase A
VTRQSRVVSSENRRVRYSLGIDVGGTFTDLVLLDAPDSSLVQHKTPSTPGDPSEGVLTGLAELAELIGLRRDEFLAEVGLIVHGTTVTTNAVLTDAGAKTALLTTEGFRDILEMRRGVRSRDHLYDNKYVAPPPLVPRYLRLPVSERVDVRGAVRRPLDEETVRDALSQARRKGVEALAICFMHSYAEPAHELRAAALVEELAPELFLAVSSEILPQVRLNDRVGTTVMSAYVGPVLSRYTDRLIEALAEASFAGTLLVMQSNGGVATPPVITRNPASTVLSGPAGGPVAALAFARGCGSEDCIVVDMGGTSFDASIVKDGEVQVTREGEINRHPIALPMIDVHTIGAGGGSIGWLDDGGLLHMGPRSAGASPGPAAYGRGGDEPTCTDADLVLGFIDPEYFLGGRMRLSPARALESVSGRIAAPLGLDTVAAAAAMAEVIDLTMAAGTKNVSLQRGYDPRELPLVVAGGAGPVHAASIADELGIATIIVPRLSSVLCAVGMLLADLRHDLTRSFSRLWNDVDPAEARAVVDELARQGVAALEEEGVPPERQTVVASADLRYIGQHHEVTISFPPADLERLERIETAFHRRHEELYGFASPGKPLQVINLHATALGSRPRFRLEPSSGGAGTAPRRAPRKIYLRSIRGLEQVEVIDGDRMAPGQAETGPVVVDTRTTTIVVPESFDVTFHPSGSFVLQRRGAESTG